MTSLKNADIVIHIDEELAPEQSNTLEQAFLQRQGVNSASINPNNRHLMVVKYDPDKINSRDLADIPRYQGYHCELVGL